MKKFTDEFMEIANELYRGVSKCKTEYLVREGFRIGTARRYSEMDKPDDLKNTTIEMVELLTKAIAKAEESDIDKRFEQFVDQAFQFIDKVPRSELANQTPFSSSMISNIKNNGREHNYQTAKFLKIADIAYIISEDMEGEEN